MRKSSLLAVSFLFAASSAYAVSHSEARDALDGVDKYHTIASDCRTAVIEYHEAGMDKPACEALLDGLGDLSRYSDILVEYTQFYQATDPNAVPHDIMVRIPKSGVKAQGIADTINLLCGRLNWCNR